MRNAVVSLTAYFASAVTGTLASCFFFQSPMAARIASSASTEQWIFTGGSESSFTMSMFLMARAWSTVLPLTHSVASEEEAMAEPQPKVLNLASSMTLVSRLTLICSFMTSPHSGAPTSPVPTSALLLSMAMLRQAIHTHIITAYYAVPLMLGRPGAMVFEITDGDGFYYRGNLFYDLVKVSVIRLAFAMALELRKKGVVAVAVTPGFLRSEAVLEHFGVSEADWKSAGEEPPGRKKREGEVAQQNRL